jgi:hypothetical protein
VRLRASLDREQWSTVAALTAIVLILHSPGAFPLLVVPTTVTRLDAE